MGRVKTGLVMCMCLHVMKRLHVDVTQQRFSFLPNQWKWWRTLNDGATWCVGASQAGPKVSWGGAGGGNDDEARGRGATDLFSLQEVKGSYSSFFIKAFSKETLVGFFMDLM